MPNRAGKPLCPEEVRRRLFRLPEKGGAVFTAGPELPFCESPEIGQGRRDGKGEHRRRRLAERGREGMPPVAGKDPCSGGKRTKAEIPVVKQAPRFRIGRQQDLEAAVEKKAVNLVGTDAPAGGLRFLK